MNVYFGYTALTFLSLWGLILFVSQLRLLPQNGQKQTSARGEILLLQSFCIIFPVPAPGLRITSVKGILAVFRIPHAPTHPQGRCLTH